MGAELDRILDEVRRELALRFSNPDDPGLYERRRRLRALFRRVPMADTRALHARLGERPTGDALSKSFHGRLSTPTRRELLKILADRFPPVSKEEPPKPEPVVVFPSNPLPVAAEERFRAAVVALREKVRITSDPRANRYRCWLAKLEGGGDDRVIQWHRICPSTSGAIGAAMIIGPCDLTAGMPIDQTEIEAAIRSVADVEPADKRLSFITHMRSQILFSKEMTADNVHLDNFRQFHDQVVSAIDKLGTWADSPIPLDRPSAAMPRAYVALMAWIAARQKDPRSVYSCM